MLQDMEQLMGSAFTTLSPCQDFYASKKHNIAWVGNLGLIIQTNYATCILRQAKSNLKT
jgi:hypothetical protein